MSSCPKCHVECRSFPDLAGLERCPRCQAVRAASGIRELSLALVRGDRLDPGPVASLGDEFLERYALQELLGGGGMGIVFSARQKSTSRMVAVKFLRLVERDTDEHRRRFIREGRVLSRLRHPNIVQIYDAGFTDQFPFLVLELVMGPSLRARLEDQGPLDAARTLGVAIPLLTGLEACHQEGILHRDLKPENVLLTSEGVPKITDFGLARDDHTVDRLTNPGQLVGTPHYFSPEMIAGDPPSRASDIYAVGVILHELLLGRPPFEARRGADIFTQHLMAEVPVLRRSVPSVPPELDQMVRRCLAKLAVDRPTATQLVAELRSLAPAGEPTSADRAGARTAPLVGVAGTQVLSTVPGRKRAGPGSMFVMLVAGLLIAAWAVSRPENPTAFVTSVTSPSPGPAGLPVPGEDDVRIGRVEGFLAEPGTLALAATPDGRWLATSGKLTRRISIWDLESRRRLMMFGPRSDPAHALAFHPGGRSLAALHVSGVVRRYDLSRDGTSVTREFEVGTFPRPAGKAMGTALVFAPEGVAIAARADESGLRVLREGEPGAREVAPGELARAGRGIRFRLDPAGLVITDGAGGLMRYSFQVGGVVNRWPGVLKAGGSWNVDPAIERLATVRGVEAEDRLVIDVTELATGRVLTLESRNNLLGEPAALEFVGPDRLVLLSESQQEKALVGAFDHNDGLLEVFDHVRQARVVTRALPPRPAKISWSPASGKLHVGFKSHRILEIDMAEPAPGGAADPSDDPAHDGPVEAVEFAGTGGDLISTGRDERLKLWEAGARGLRLKSQVKAGEGIGIDARSGMVALLKLTGRVSWGSLDAVPLTLTGVDGTHSGVAIATAPVGAAGGARAGLDRLVTLARGGELQVFSPDLAGREGKEPVERFPVPPAAPGDDPRIHEPGAPPLAPVRDPPVPTIPHEKPIRPLAWIRQTRPQVVVPGEGPPVPIALHRDHGVGMRRERGEIVFLGEGAGGPRDLLRVTEGHHLLTMAVAAGDPALVALTVELTGSHGDHEVTAPPGTDPSDGLTRDRWHGGVVRRLQLWTYRQEAGSWRPRVLPPAPFPVSAAAVAAHGERVAIGGPWGKVAVLDARDPDGWRELEGLRTQVSSLVLEDPGTRLAAGCLDGGLAVWILARD